MHLGVPQVILTSICLIGFGVNIAKHGQDKNDKYSGWTSLVAILIEFTLLYWGGFFK